MRVRRPIRSLLVPLAAAALAVTGTVAVTGGGEAAAAPESLDGYTAASSAAERAVEQQFLQYPSAELADSLDKELAAHTGLVGTVNDRRRKDEIVARLKSFGLTPHVSTYYVYMSSPKKVSVDMTSPRRFHAANIEQCRSVETDCEDVVVGYNALSPSGNVTAPVVYVNYGTTSDYATLARAAKLGDVHERKVRPARELD